MTWFTVSVPSAIDTAAAPLTRRSRASAQPFRFAATVALAPGVLLVTFNGLRPLSGATVADLFFVVGAGFLALHVLSTSETLPRVPLWLAGSAYAILAIGLLSALFAPTVVLRPLTNSYGSQVTLPVSTSFGADIASAVRFAGTVLLVPLLIGMVSDSRIRMERFVDLWLASASINGLIALSDAFHLTTIGAQVTGLAFTSLSREAGLTLHPNHLATVAAMALPVAFSRATTAQSGLRRWLTWGSMGMIAAGIGVSGARAGLLAAAIGVLLVLLLQRRERGRMVAGVAIAGAAILLLSVAGGGALGKLSVGVDRLVGGHNDSTRATAGSDAARQINFDSAIDAISQRPITGTGFEGLREAHDLYLQIAQGGGVLLLCAFGVFAAGALRTGYRLSRDPRLSADMQSLAGALMVSMVVWLIAGVAQNPLYDRYLYVPLGLLLGLCFLAQRTADPAWEGLAVRFTRLHRTPRPVSQSRAGD